MKSKVIFASFILTNILTDTPVFSIKPQIFTLETYEDLRSKSTSSLALKNESSNFLKMEKEEIASSIPTSQPLPPIKERDLLLINVGHGMIRSCTEISKKNTEDKLYTQHEKFLSLVKKSNEEDYTALTQKAKLASGNEFIKVGENGLPTLLDDLSKDGVNIIPLTSRGDDGKSSIKDQPEVLSRTEKEFVALKYNWKTWKKPTPFQDPTMETHLQDNSPETHGTYKLRNGIIYHVTGGGKTPHKSAAIIGLIHKLKEENKLPSAIYITDREDTTNDIYEDLKGSDFEIPLYLFKYTQPKAFTSSEELQSFYTHRLGEKFRKYESEFKEAFLIAK